MSDLQDLADDAMREAVESITEQLEYELRGAWRAGYDYVHVYDALQCDGVQMDAYSIRKAVVPAHYEHPPKPPGYAYRYTYDLCGVSDEEVRAAIRGG